ncbi:MAG: shikimate dehydrogenase [Gemmatimonadota bacterium]|nr:shikimate dehydrogenase [Gemmatimonadota bacterium]
MQHSLSPRFQNAAFRAAGVDGLYLALRCDEDSLPGLLQGIARAGGGGNVTLPHKEHAARLVERRTPALERTGACNAFWLEDSQIWGDNTDVAGFSAATRGLLGGSPAGARVLLLGAGGAGRAALCALVDEGAEEIVLLNRTPARAQTLAERFTSGVRVAGSMEQLRGERFDLAVNATSLGLRAEDPLPLPATGGPAFSAALDLVYAPEETPWVRHLRGRGIPAADGLEMLLQQGAAAFERWWRVPASLEAMRAALPPRGGKPGG